MAVYLSPGVFPREIDLSALPAGRGPLRPVFIGTAQKGPVNVPTFVSTAQQFIDTFGEPIVESPMGFAVLNYMEEGNQAYVMRVGVEAEDGQDSALAAIAIDTSGARLEGWGRMPLFTGIDYGRINLRTPDTDNPFDFHPASVSDEEFVDLNLGTGPSTGSITVTGTYTGAVDDSFIVMITGAPGSALLDGATYQVIRNSDGAVINTGVLVESVAGTSDTFDCGAGDDANGLTLQVTVAGESLDVGDYYSFNVVADNRSFEIEVQGVTGGSFTMPTVSYPTTDAFVTAFNTLVGLGVDFEALNVDGVPQIVTKTAGDRIQVVSGEGWCLHVGIALYAFDISRSYLLSGDTGPFNISSQNDRVRISSLDPLGTKDIDASITHGTSQAVASVAGNLNSAGTVSGVEYYVAFALQTGDDQYQVCIVAGDDRVTSVLKMQATFSFPKTLKFADELNVPFPYTRNYRGFFDPRVSLPDASSSDPEVPASCDPVVSQAQCDADSAYYQNIVGWIVAKSPGTWVDDLKVSIELFQNLGDRYSVRIFKSNVEVDRIDNVSFDASDERYIANVINAGSTIGGTNGDPYIEWESRTVFTDEVRNPVPVDPFFTGQANGIPTDPVFSSELDRAIIGNPQVASGLYAFSNPETFDFNLLLIPGNSSGAVIGAALQFCESRGDCLYIVDSPFGLRPQQVVDWHNGMLFSDLRAAINSSYGALYWPWIKIFNQFDGSELFVPPSGFVAGVFSRTAREREQWFAPAGLNRGHLLTALDVEVSATQGERDLLYGSGNAVNPIVKFPQDGINVFGQRTLQRRQSALDRINVRMLLIYLKKNLISLLRFFLFEPIDRFLFAEVRAAINPFLEDVMARRGLTGFKVICDETNNTPERIDRNELHVTVMIKPTKAAEFIVLDLVILRTDMSFAAEEVLAAAGIVGV